MKWLRDERKSLNGEKSNGVDQTSEEEKGEDGEEKAGEDDER